MLPKMECGDLMMHSKEDAYFAQLDELNGLSKPKVREDMSKASLISMIRDNAHRIQTLRQSNDSILNELVYDRQVKDMDRQEVNSLIGFADRPTSNKSYPDIFLPHSIHKKLLQWSELNGDTDLRVRELYKLGTTMVYMNVKNLALGINLFYKDISRYYTEGASYISKYEDICSEKTRGYILRCLGNRKYGTLHYGNYWPKVNCDNVMESFRAYMNRFDEAMTEEGSQTRSLTA